MRPEDREKAVFVVLRAISGNTFLREMLYLKGAYATEGHTGRPRSTQDVDFTVAEMLGTPNAEGERKVKRLFIEAVENHLELQDRDRDWSLYQVSVNKSPSSKRHPRGWDSFEVRITLRIRGRARHTVKLEITPEDDPIDSVEISCETGAVAEAESSAANTVKTYSAAEIVAEKLRAFLQSLPPYRIKMGGGDRTPRVRDIWDIAVLVEMLGDQLDVESVARKFQRKCASRLVDCCSVDDYSPKPDSIEIYRQNYEADDELATIPFNVAWKTMIELVGRIENEFGLPGAFPIDEVS